MAKLKPIIMSVKGLTPMKRKAKQLVKIIDELQKMIIKIDIK